MHSSSDTESSLGVLDPGHQACQRNQILRFALAAKHLQLGEPTLRHLRHYAEDRKSASGQVIPGNGFAPAFLTLGRALYVDVIAFVEIWRSQQAHGNDHG